MMKSASELSVWKRISPYGASLQAEPGPTELRVSWVYRESVCRAQDPIRRAVRPARDKADHLKHQGVLL